MSYHATHVFQCDVAGCCGIFTASGELLDVWCLAQDEGWERFMRDGTWKYYCPDCEALMM